MVNESSLGHCYGTGSIPGPGKFYMPWAKPEKKKKNPRNLGSAKTLPLLDCNTMCEALGTLLALVLASETDQLNLSLRVCRDKVRPELWSVVVKIFQILCDSSDQKILQLRRRSLQ